MSDIAGGCRCGLCATRLLWTHCRRLMPVIALIAKRGAAARSSQTFLPEEALAVTGPLSVYELTTPSGRVSNQRMCSICHTRIYNSSSARPGVIVVRAGTLDHSDQLDAVAHIWVKRKQQWLELPQDVPTWPEGAPVEALLQALSRRRTDA